MKGTPSPWRIAVDVWQAQNASQQGLSRRRTQRLTDLVAFARARSAFYRRHYSGLPDGLVALESLPPVRKPQLMAAFDDWITDPALGRGGVEAILSKVPATGVAYHDGLFVCTSSGTTGQPGIFVHDAGAVDVYRVLNAIRLGCAQGWIHINSDWAILEPVDENFRPTSPGTPSHTVLLTNLANRIQPIIRYDLGDSIIVRPDPCPCGSHLQAIRVAGRCDDILRLVGADGQTVAVLPLAIGSVLEEVPGGRRSQLCQTGSSTLRVRLSPTEDADLERLWREVMEALRSFLNAQGLAEVDIVRADEPPEPSGRSGKFRQVMGMTGRGMQ